MRVIEQSGNGEQLHIGSECVREALEDRRRVRQPGRHRVRGAVHLHDVHVVQPSRGQLAGDRRDRRAPRDPDAHVVVGEGRDAARRRACHAGEPLRVARADGRRHDLRRHAEEVGDPRGEAVDAVLRRVHRDLDEPDLARVGEEARDGGPGDAHLRRDILHRQLLHVVEVRGAQRIARAHIRDVVGLHRGSPSCTIVLFFPVFAHSCMGACANVRGCSSVGPINDERDRR